MTCPRCCLDPRDCLCAAVPSVATRTRFLILRHAIEAKRRTNSGRIAALALPNSEVIEPKRDLAFPPGTWLLYPGGQAPPAGLPEALVVLDGSWREARRMFIRTPALQRLPRLSLPPPAKAPARLRRSASPGNMATLEAIARAVGILEGDEAARPLHALFEEFVRRSTAGARRVGRRLS